jgi:hypothetical protein
MPITKEQYDEACLVYKDLKRKRVKTIRQIDELRQELFVIDAELSVKGAILTQYELENLSPKLQDIDD